jgi:hypothetical protein
MEETMREIFPTRGKFTSFPCTVFSVCRELTADILLFDPTDGGNEFF